VLVYVDADRRRAFGLTVRDLNAVWLSNEARGVVPLPAATPAHPDRADSFTLICNGIELLAFTDSHRTRIDWVSRSHSVPLRIGQRSA
jgi:hypothetical protein